MIERVRKYINKYHMIVPSDRIVLGISGGADSVCLFFALLELQKELGFEMFGVHVHHGLRKEEADKDECYVKDLCAKEKVLCHVYRFDVTTLAKAEGRSIEEMGRIVRQRAFYDLSEKEKGTKIALAHHKDDNAETLLMNLMRGTRLKGLGGIQPIQGKVIRPLLDVRRIEIEEYLNKKKTSYCTDMTNESDLYTRNKVRHQILPKMEEINPKSIEHMNETMEQLRELQEYMEEQVKAALCVCAYWEEDSYILKISEFRKVPNILKSMLIHHCLKVITKEEQNLSKVHVEQVLELFDRQVGKCINLPYGVRVRRVYEGVCLEKQKNNGQNIVEPVLLQIPGTTKIPGEFDVKCKILKKNEDVAIPQKDHTKWLNYDIIGANVQIRTRKKGDYITINKDGNKKSLKSYFIDEKVPSGKRDEVLLLAEDAHIIWIVGYRTNSRYQVNEKTKQILEIKLEKQGENHE